MTDQPTLPKGRPAQSPQPHGAAGIRPQEAQTESAGGPPPVQFIPHEPGTGSPASSAAKTSGVVGAPLFGLLALAAVGVAGGGVGAGLGTLPGIPGLEGSSVKRAGPQIARGAATEQTGMNAAGMNAAFTASGSRSAPARPAPGVALIFPPGTVVGGPITGAGAPPPHGSAPVQSSPEPAGPQAGGQPRHPRAGTPGVLPPVGTTPPEPNPPSTTTPGPTTSTTTPTTTPTTTTTTTPTTTTTTTGTTTTGDGTTTTTTDGTPTTTTPDASPGNPGGDHHHHDPGYYPGQ